MNVAGGTPGSERTVRDALESVVFAGRGHSASRESPRLARAYRICRSCRSIARADGPNRLCNLFDLRNRNVVRIGRDKPILSSIYPPLLFATKTTLRILLS